MIIYFIIKFTNYRFLMVMYFTILICDIVFKDEYVYNDICIYYIIHIVYYAIFYTLYFYVILRFSLSNNKK